jgi:hypothetical protein
VEKKIASIIFGQKDKGKKAMKQYEQLAKRNGRKISEGDDTHGEGEDTHGEGRETRTMRRHKQISCLVLVVLLTYVWCLES